MPSCMAGGCPHPRECEDYGVCRYEVEHEQQQPDYTEADECEGRGHPYYGEPHDPREAPEDQREQAMLTAGSCYCGKKTYPMGGRLELATDGTLDPFLPTEGEVVVSTRGNVSGGWVRKVDGKFQR